MDVELLTSPGRRKRAARASGESRLAIASRVTAAALGGYAFAALGAVLIARALPIARPDATMLGTLLSFVFYTAAILWAFAARSAGVAWFHIVVGCVLLAAGIGFTT